MPNENKNTETTLNKNIWSLKNKDTFFFSEQFYIITKPKMAPLNIGNKTFLKKAFYLNNSLVPVGTTKLRV